MLFILFFILYSSRTISGEGCNNHKCPFYSVTHHYREINCIPEYEEGNENCPIAYDCPLLRRVADNPRSCFFNGTEYYDQDELVNEHTQENCASHCVCSTLQSPSKFICAHNDCPEDIGVPAPIGCYYGRRLRKCCNYRICRADGEFMKKSCLFKGKTYRHGEMFKENECCKRCFCEDGQVNCQDLVCGTELNYISELAKGAAPIYYGHGDCCPFDYVYPSSKDRVIPMNQTRNSSLSKYSSRYCVYGNHIAYPGEKIITKYTDEYTTCKCLYPPIITCILYRN